MNELLVVTGVAMVLAVGIGANDETFAPVVGSKRLTINQSVIIGSSVVIVGALVLGKKVASTVGTKISKISFQQNEILIILFSVAILLILSSWKGLPISTTHAMVGSTITLAFISARSMTNVPATSDIIDLSVVYNILFAWVISPALGLIGSYYVMKGILLFKSKYIKGLDDVDNLESFFSIGLILAVIITGFSRGANDVSNAVAPLISSYVELASETGTDFYSILPLLLGGIFMSIGLILIGRNVLRTLGNDVVELSPTTAFSVQSSTALITFIAASIGLPISGTHVLVAAFVGTGFAAKSRINMKTVKKIVASALGTPFFAGFTTFIVWTIASRVI